MLARSLAVAAVLAASSAARAQDPILQQLPADSTNVLVVRDLLPHVEALLKSPELQQLATATKELQQQFAGLSLEPATLQKQLALFRGFVPTEVVIAAPSSAVGTMVDVLRGGAAIAVLSVADKQLGAEASQPLRDIAIEAITSLQAPVLTAWLRTRDERTAESWFDSLAESARALATDPALQVKVTDQKIELTVQPLAVAGGALQKLLQRVGVDGAPLAKIACKVALEQDGTMLRVRVGEPAAGPLPAQKLGALWQPGPTQLLFARVDSADAMERALNAWDTFDQLDTSSLDPMVQALVLQIVAALDKLTNGMADPEYSLTIGDGLVFAMECDLETDEPLEVPTIEVARVVDRNDGPFTLGAASLDIELASLRSSMLEMFTRMLRSSAAGRDRAATASLLDGWQSLQERLTAFDEFLEGDESSVFAPGTALVTRAARLTKLRVGAPDALRDLPAAELPFAAGAIVAMAQNDGDGDRFVERCTALLGEALGFDGKAAWKDADLGLGAPAHVLQWQAMLPKGIAVEIAGDFQPHWIEHNKLLVLSTDPALTRLLLARADGTVAQKAPVDGLLSWTHARGEQLGAFTAGLERWRAAFVVEPKLQPMLQGIALFAPLIDHIETIERLDGSRYRSATTLRLRRAAK